jgi:hypothetical protein
MRKLLMILCIGGLLLGSVSAYATTVDIYAYANSVKKTPLDTGITVATGDELTITTAFDDFWAAGGGPRTSNADGLGNPFGYNYGYYTYNGFSARYGALVGRIDTGNYFLVGTDFSDIVSESGNLILMYWDSNYGDNSGYVTADINAVSPTPTPEPATLFLLGSGLGGLCGATRKKIKT